MMVLTQHAAGTFCWPELLTTDQDGAKKFYGSLFGWTHTDTPMGPAGVYTIFHKHGKDCAALASLNPEQKSKGVPPFWGAYVSVTSTDATASKAKQLGGKLLMEPFDVIDKGRMALIQDPTGATFSLWQPKTHIGAGVLDEPGALCWTELLTGDTEKAKTFYTQLIGWKAEPMPMPQGVYTVFKRADGVGAAGMMQLRDDMRGVPPNWLSYFQVEDAQATVKKAGQASAKTLVPPTPIPNVGTFAVLQDPKEAAFGILEPSR